MTKSLAGIRKQAKKFEAQQKAAAKAQQGQGKQQLENPLGGLAGGGLRVSPSHPLAGVTPAGCTTLTGVTTRSAPQVRGRPWTLTCAFVTATMYAWGAEEDLPRTPHCP